MAVCLPPLSTRCHTVPYMSTSKYVCICMKWNLGAEYNAFLFRPRVFLALSVAGYAGGPPVHGASGFRPGSVAGALGGKVTKFGE